MKIAIFGGTFDPIHSGHMQAAKAAIQRFHLNKVLFVPTGCPPHKTSNGLTDYHHRFAMVALACAEDPRFVPSTLESPDLHPGPHYSIDTVRRVKHMLRPGDRLYFLIGLDALLDLHHWKQFRHLLDLTDFIVVSRPGFEIGEVERALPGPMLGRIRRKNSHQIRLRRTTVYILPHVEVPVASTDLRRAIQQHHDITGLVPPPVEQYILKEGLYRSATQIHGGK
ncbi:MAG: nicotinate (nicotinamide) nucleotide adenylyltransferase [Acidobacteria bacterium]|nr:MAG: nicotinate (nicotinamide) nucleotide adenylyltransferase [Acidobacteriota bacterium]